MYQFSRSIYRELSTSVVPTKGEDIAVTRMRFLRACETSMERLALDRHYFARPVHTLFADVRHFFPIADQLRVYRLVAKHVELATEYVDSQLRTGVTKRAAKEPLDITHCLLIGERRRGAILLLVRIRAGQVDERAIHVDDHTRRTVRFVRNPKTLEDAVGRLPRNQRVGRRRIDALLRLR